MRNQGRPSVLGHNAELVRREAVAGGLRAVAQHLLDHRGETVKDHALADLLIANLARQGYVVRYDAGARVRQLARDSQEAV